MKVKKECRRLIDFVSTSCHQKMSELYAELFGRVARVIAKGKGRESVFIVHTQTQNKDYKCICPFFCPIEEGDAIYAICEIEDSYQLRVIRPPFVQIAMDKDSILRCFQRILKGTGFGASKANRLYDVLASATKGSSDIASRVISYLTELSALWKDSKDDDLLIPYVSVVSKEQMRKLLSWWYKNRSLRRLYLFGLTNREIEACKLSHDQIYERCLSNPYTLVGLSLEKCDEVLSRQNKTGAPEDRRCGQMVRKVHDYLMDRAWTGVPALQMLRLFPDLTDHLPRLSREYEVVAEGETIYLRYPYMVEMAIAEKIQTLMRSSRVTPDTPMDSKDRESADYVIKTLTPEQKDAIQGALDYPVSIITGSAGCGKTLLIGEIIHNLELRNIPYVVASFTGKAVSRVREAIKRKDPSTLHRLIARSHLIKKFKHLIIDEASMVTAELMYQFFKAFPYEYAITLVGDPHQLPPIGWGSLFDELLKAKCVPTFYLSQNHRLERIQSIGPDGSTQELENGIMINANAIVDKFHPHSDGDDDPVPFDFVQTDNFTLIEGSIERVYDIIRAMYSQNIPADQVTVITPYNKDLDDLNKTYQEIYNEGNRSAVDSRGKLWMVRDRVMMLENQYSINVFNGEELMVVDIDEESIVAMTKDGTQHRFNLEPKERKNEDDDEPEEDELTVQLLGHSFVISVHKSQGSEWAYVIIYLPPNPANNTFLNRNLIYTAITRAKRAVWCVGDIDALRAAAIRPCPKRHETLAERLNPQLVTMVVPEPDIPADIPAIPIAIPTTLQITDTPD
jgi:hypothetical protein